MQGGTCTTLGPACYECMSCGPVSEWSCRSDSHSCVTSMCQRAAAGMCTCMIVCMCSLDPRSFHNEGNTLGFGWLVSEPDPLPQEREGSGELHIQALSHWNAISWMT